MKQLELDLLKGSDTQVSCQLDGKVQQGVVALMAKAIGEVLRKEGSEDNEDGDIS